MARECIAKYAGGNQDMIRYLLRFAWDQPIRGADH